VRRAAELDVLDGGGPAQGAGDDVVVLEAPGRVAAATSLADERAAAAVAVPDRPLDLRRDVVGARLGGPARTRPVGLAAPLLLEVLEKQRHGAVDDLAVTIASRERVREQVLGPV
jgi:hypothetical protein